METTNTIISLQTRTSTSVQVITFTLPESEPTGTPFTSTTAPPIVETRTSLFVFTATLTGIITITEPGSASVVTPGLDATSLPSGLEIPLHSSGTSTPSGSTSWASSAVPDGTRPPTIPPSSASSFSESLGPISRSQPSPTGFNNSSTEFPLPPSSTTGRNPEGSNKTLVGVLPSVLLPLFLIIVLTCLVFWKRRKRRRSATMSTLAPFTDSRGVSRPIGFAKNAFVMTKRIETTTVIGEEPPTISGRLDNPPYLQHGYRGVGVTSGDNQIEGGALPAVVEEPELPVTSSDNLVVPASRSEILELQTRLANIEARRISLPPPEYSSERG